jgi:NitT/TauT family transport system permease protein
MLANRGVSAAGVEILRSIGMRSSSSRRIVLPLLLAGLLLLAWQVLTAFHQLNPVILPAPGAVVDSLWQNLPLLTEQGYYTVQTSLVALLISSAIGISTGIILIIWRQLKDALFPNIVLFELIPKIALAPLFVIWFGTGIELRIAFAVFLSVFPVLLATMAGLTATDPSVIRLCRALNASVLQTFFLVRLPYAAPFIFSGIKVGSTMAMIGVVIAEFLTGNTGLGYMIMFATTNLESSLMLSSILLLCIFGMALFWGVEFVERLLAKKYEVPAA